MLRSRQIWLQKASPNLHATVTPALCCVLQATKDVLAMASLEVDLSAIEPGNTITVKWRGKPVFIKHRTEEEIGKAKDEDISKLRDPEEDDARTQKPEVMHLILL